MTRELEARAHRADQALRELGDEDRRRVTAGYFPTAMEILGVSAREMRTVLRTVVNDLQGEGPDRVLTMTRMLRSLGTHEGRQVAFELLDRRKDARALLGPQ